MFDALRPGVAVADLYAIAAAVVTQGLPPHFAPASLALPGFVGHGIGLELDEPPVLWPREEARLQARTGHGREERAKLGIDGLLVTQDREAIESLEAEDVGQLVGERHLRAAEGRHEGTAERRVPGEALH